MLAMLLLLFLLAFNVIAWIWLDYHGYIIVAAVLIALLYKVRDYLEE